jgi:hypothetical protein
MRALQVLSVNGHVISEPKLKSMLTELVGDGEYRVTSSDMKHGYQVLHALVGDKSELMIYCNKKVIRAFVISLD